MEELASILETIMIISFGISWPLNLLRAYRSRSTGGKSILFDYFIFIGYIAGLSSKMILHHYNLAFYFYIINIIMVFLDIVLYYRNREYEKSQKTGCAKCNGGTPCEEFRPS